MYTLPCPQCATQLQLSAPAPEGSSLRCPRCGHVFAIGAPRQTYSSAPPAPAPQYGGGYGEPHEQMPPSRPRRQRQGSSNKGLIIGLSVGGGLLVVAVVVVVLILVLRSSSDSRLVGRWDVVQIAGAPGGLGGARITFDFRGDGTVNAQRPGGMKTAKWRMIDSQTLEIEDPPPAAPQRVRVDFIGDEVTFTNVAMNVQTMRLRRAR